jgi:hypothetical protein
MYSSTLSLTSALGGVGGQRHAPGALPPGKWLSTHCIGGWVGPRAGLGGCGKSRPHQDSIPDRPARSKSLYRLSYPGPPYTYIHTYIYTISVYNTSKFSNLTLPTFYKAREGMYVKRSIEPRSRNHCYRGKAISVKYSECVSVAIVIQQINGMRVIAIRGLSSHTIPFHIISLNRTIFGEKLLNIKCVFWYRLRLFS